MVERQTACSLLIFFIFLQSIHFSLPCQPTTVVPGGPPTEPGPQQPTESSAPVPSQRPPSPTPSPTTRPITPAPTNPPTTTDAKTSTTTKVETTTTTKIVTTTKPTPAAVNQECTTVSNKMCSFPFLDTCITTKYEKCVFPFVYKGVTYDSCTTYHATGNNAWCATSTDAGGNMKRWGDCVSFEGSSWCATAVTSEGVISSWDFCKECKSLTTTPLPTTTSKMVTGAVTVETQTTTIPSGPKSAEMGCGCNCGCKLAAEYVMAIVSGDAEALAEMAHAQPPAP